MLDELHQPSPVERIEETTDVEVEHPVHLSRQHSGIERIQRMVLAASGPEPVREAEEVSFVDGAQHLDRGTLDDFVFQRSHPERPLPPVSLGDVHPTHRLGSVRSPLEPISEFVEVFLQSFAIVPPRLAVHPRRGFPSVTQVSRTQPLQIIDRSAGAR